MEVKTANIDRIIEFYTDKGDNTGEKRVLFA